MAKKKEMKVSEARILVYLSQVSNLKKSLEDISSKLSTDYIYTIRILKDMVGKNWLFKHKFGRKMFYDLRLNAPIEMARELLTGEALDEVEEATSQTTLEADIYGMPE